MAKKSNKRPEQKSKPYGRKLPVATQRTALLRENKIVIAVTLIGILFVTWIPYRSTLDSGFTVWDDPDYVLYNTNILSLYLKTVSYLFTQK